MDQHHAISTKIVLDVRFLGSGVGKQSERPAPTALCPRLGRSTKCIIHYASLFLFLFLFLLDIVYVLSVDERLVQLFKELLFPWS